GEGIGLDRGSIVAVGSQGRLTPSRTFRDPTSQQPNLLEVVHSPEDDRSTSAALLWARALPCLPASKQFSSTGRRDQNARRATRCLRFASGTWLMRLQLLYRCTQSPAGAG